MLDADIHCYCIHCLINMFLSIFQITVQYPSCGARTHVLTGEHEIIGRSIATGSNIGKAIAACPTVAEEVFNIRASQIKQELDVLSSKSDKTLLRCKDEASLRTFSWKKLNDELEKKAPKFIATMKIVCANDAEKMKRELPAILSAASTLLAVHNPELSALEYIKSLILLKGGAKKFAFTRFNAIKSCMSYTMTLAKANEIANNADLKMITWQTTVWRDRCREQQIIQNIDRLKGSTDVNSVLNMRSLEHELHIFQKYMSPGYYVVGDNADMRTHVRHHRLDHVDVDAHMFQMSAYRNRVAANHLEPNIPLDDIKTAPFSKVLPSLEDHEELLYNMAYHVAQTWIQHLKPFKGLQMPPRFHEHSDQTKTRTERVSTNVLNIHPLTLPLFFYILFYQSFSEMFRSVGRMKKKISNHQFYF